MAKIEVFRFMSKKELEDYKKGKRLKNTTIHKSKTNSVGFCFLDAKEYKPEEAFHFLSGIVNPEICVVFEVDEDKLDKSWGKYAKPIKETGNGLQDLINLFENWDVSFIANEYCTQIYSKKDFKLVRYAVPDWLNKDDWDWIGGENEDN